MEPSDWKPPITHAGVPCSYDSCEWPGYCDGQHCATAGGTIRSVTSHSLTKKDFQYLQLKLSSELMTYLSHSIMGSLREGHETEHLEYLKGLSDRLEEAEKLTSVTSPSGEN